MVYQLSEKARQMTYTEWFRIGGIAVPGNSIAPKLIGSESSWKTNGVTLGQIEDACPFTGRSLAGFFVRNLNMPDMAIEYQGA